MKTQNILVTGGAGFIGSHLVDALVKKNYTVRVLDNLDPQVHQDQKLPSYFNKHAEFIQGDVTNKADWEKALTDIDVVFHLASAVGVGQSMYEIEHYVKVNSYGTALLLDILANNKHTVKKILFPASMTSYGEGMYQCNTCGIVRPSIRTSVVDKLYEPVCPNCQSKIEKLATKEDATLHNNSIYAVTKNNQEEMIMVFGKAYKIPTISLRLFNVYGTRQSLSNPYTGVAAIFLSRVKNNQSPLINEDGLQTRDFIHVSDVAVAFIKAMEDAKADFQIFNVGSGHATSIKEVARVIIKLMRSSVKPEITYKFRTMDIRHCFADITKIQQMLKWEPHMSFEDGMKALITWGEKEEAVDQVGQAMEELHKRKLQ